MCSYEYMQCIIVQLRAFLVFFQWYSLVNDLSLAEALPYIPKQWETTRLVSSIAIFHLPHLQSKHFPSATLPSGAVRHYWHPCFYLSPVPCWPSRFNHRTNNHHAVPNFIVYGGFSSYHKGAPHIWPDRSTRCPHCDEAAVMNVIGESNSESNRHCYFLDDHN